MFEAFGTIKNVELAPDNVPNKHRGWGYIDYEIHKSATDAIASMNLFDLGGQFLRVGRVSIIILHIFPPAAQQLLPSVSFLCFMASIDCPLRPNVIAFIYVVARQSAKVFHYTVLASCP